MKWFKGHREQGFTFVEIAVVAPIVILAIGAFITAVVSMTGEVLVSRTSTQMVYNVQDALNRIDQDVKQSSTFLAETNIAITSPQGYADNTTVFDNVDSTKGTMLILNTLATTGNPLATTSSIAYLNNSPNACGSLQGQNTPLTFNVVYFVKSNTLWRRTIAQSGYATNACNQTGSGTAAPWQQPSCTTAGGFCKTLDERLVDGVSTTGFNIQYFNGSGTNNENTAASANPSCNTASCVATRNSALLSSSTINATIDAHQTVAGKDVEQVASIRSTRLETTATAIAPAIVPAIPSVPAPTGKTPNTIGTTGTSTNVTQVTYNWTPSSGGGTITYSVQYQINGGSMQTVNGITNSGTPNYTIPGTNFGNVVTAQVKATNSAGASAWSSVVTVTVPLYAVPQTQNNWKSYGAGWSTIGFSQTTDGIVSVKGFMALGSATANAPIFTLPTGFRPTQRYVFPVVTSNGSSVNIHGRVDIDTDGTVQFESGSSEYISLDGINFLSTASAYSFTTPTLTNSWANYGGSYATEQYTTDSKSRVHLKGSVKSGAGSIQTLPSAAWPGNDSYYSADSNSSIGDYKSNVSSSAGNLVPVTGGNTIFSTPAMYYAGAAGSWTSLTYSNSWVNFGSTYSNGKYVKATDGIVTLKGLVKSGTTGTMSTLPAGSRPKTRLVFHTIANDQFARIDIDASGNIIVVTLSSNTWLTLDGINFLAEQ